MKYNVTDNGLCVLHIFSFVFGQCSITIPRHIRQFVIEQNNSITSSGIGHCVKQIGRQFVNGHSKLNIVHTFRDLQIVWPMSSLFRLVGSSVEGTLTNRLECMPNCFEDMPFFTHNVEDMLNDELKPNFGD